MSGTPFEFFQTSDGIRLRYGFWPYRGAARRGTVVVLGGRTEFMEKYVETIGEVNLRGFDAFSFDWRGQGHSDRVLADPTRGYIETYDHYLVDLRAFIDQIVKPNCSSPLVVMAHSMGGNVALRYLREFPDRIDKAVLLSPMIGIRTNPIPNWIARIYSRTQAKLGKADRNLPSLRRNDSFHGAFSNNCLTHDKTRFHRVRQLIRDDPRLMISGVTYGWLVASFASVDAVRTPGYAERITTPTLIVTAGRDRVVDNKAIQRVADRLPAHQLVCVEDAYHEILQERDDLRAIFWSAFDGFIHRPL